MKLYENTPQSHYEESKSYFPSWYADFKEMDAIWRVTGDMLDDIQANILKIIDNASIVNADMDTVYRLEDWLGIRFTSPRTDDARKRFLLMLIAGFGKCSRTKIKQVIKRYTGADSSVTFEIIDDERNYGLIIDIDRGDADVFYLADVQFILEKLIPAHIAYKIMVVFPTIIEVNTVITRWRYTYDVCGVKPDVSMRGRFNGLQEDYHADLEKHKYEYTPSEKDGVAGVLPDVSTFGRYHGFDIEYLSEIESHEHEYTPTSESIVAGTIPTISTLGRASDFGIEVTTDGQVFIHDHNSAGLVPEVATIWGEAQSEVKYNTENSRYLHEHTPAGTVPDAATLGGSLTAKVEAKSEISLYPVEYPQTTQDAVSGVTPATATIGGAVDVESNAETQIKAYSTEYRKTEADGVGTPSPDDPSHK